MFNGVARSLIPRDGALRFARFKTFVDSIRLRAIQSLENATRDISLQPSIPHGYLCSSTSRSNTRRSTATTLRPTTHTTTTDGISIPSPAISGRSCAARWPRPVPELDAPGGSGDRNGFGLATCPFLPRPRIRQHASARPADFQELPEVRKDGAPRETPFT